MQFVTDRFFRLGNDLRLVSGQQREIHLRRGKRGRAGDFFHVVFHFYFYF